MSTILAGVGLAAAVAGSAPAIGAVAVLGAVTFVATTYAPAATAMMIELAALPVDSPPCPAEVWNAVQPALTYIVKQNLDQAVSVLLDKQLAPAGEVAQAAGALINSAFNPTSPLTDRIANTIVGPPQEACAPGVEPVEISFNPDYVRCPTSSTTATSGGTSGSSGSSGYGGGSGGANPCITGAGVAANPAPWIEACTKLDPRLTVPLTCLDANPAFDLPSPTLSNGTNPASACQVFHDADGAGTSLGTAQGCDHEAGPITCYCCPPGS
jgi:hypothetical protein